MGPASHKEQAFKETPDYASDKSRKPEGHPESAPLSE
jgi:hypothetical protein